MRRLPWWAAPVVAGTVVAAATALLVPLWPAPPAPTMVSYPSGTPAGPPVDCRAHVPAANAWPLAHPAGARNDSVLLAIAPAATPCGSAKWPAPCACPAVTWLTPRIVAVHPVACPDDDAARCPPWAPAAPDAAGDGTPPRFGVDGHWTLRATFLAFTGDGRLALAGADANVTAAFPGSPERIPDVAWYLGPGVAPPGTRVPSATALRVLAPLADRVVGLPVGAVASAHLDDEAVRQVWGGGLYATLRVDALP